MTKATRVLAAAFLAVVLGSGAGTAEAQSLTLAVRVRNDAREDERVLAAALASVMKIYAQAGIDVVWVPSDARVTVILITRGHAEPMHQSKNVMGYAPASGAEGGRLAYVLDHRVGQVSLGYGAEKAGVLAAALAHEIGHLLLPSKSHSPTGLMRAILDGSDFRNAQRGELLFTTEQARLIRERLEIGR